MNKQTSFSHVQYGIWYEQCGVDTWNIGPCDSETNRVLCPMVRVLGTEDEASRIAQNLNDHLIDELLDAEQREGVQGIELVNTQ